MFDVKMHILRQNEEKVESLPHKGSEMKKWSARKKISHKEDLFTSFQ
jgi:hypothetical protein